MRKVSLIIPTYNSGSYLRDTLDSVMALKGERPEVIVVDDGSSDGTVALARSYPDIRVVEQKNSGDAAARDHGLALASGQFVMYLDHDDLLLPDAMNLHLAAIEADDSLAMVFGSNFFIDGQNNRVGENWQPQKRFSGRDVAIDVTPSFSACMYRKSALDRIGGFRREARSSADIDLNLRLLGWQPSGYCHGAMVMSYRLHAGQQTKSPSKLYRQHMQVLGELLGPDGLLPDPELLRAADKHWRTYFGQFIPSEIARAGFRRDWKTMGNSAQTFLHCMPYSALGAKRFVMKKLRSRFSSK